MQPSDQKDNKNIRNDEIDLGPVLNGIQAFFSKIGDGLSFVGEAIHRYITSVIIVSILALLIGYGIYKIQRPVYYSSMVVTSQYLSPVYYHHIISELDLLIKDQNFEELSNKLKIPEKMARNFETMYYLPLVVEGDTIEENQPFRVVVASHDGKIFRELTDPMASFLEKNEFAQKQKRIRTEQLQSSIQTLEQEIEQLDSLKKVLEKSMLKDNTNSSGFVFEENPDPVTVYEQKMELFNSNQYSKSQLAQINNIEVIYPFTVRTQADEPSIIASLLIALLVGIIVGIIYATFKLNRNQIKE